MYRTDIINYLIKNNNYKTYLEIGVRNKDDNFNKILCEDKCGVDPDPNTKTDFIMESDLFFSNNKKKFDIIFIDGLHIQEQFIKDVNNSLSFLNPLGCIVCHDCLPHTFEEQLVPQIQDTWTGDVWKGFCHFRSTREDLSMYTVDTDFGCGVIKLGKQKLFKTNNNLDYDFFVKNKLEMMNIISCEEFIQKEKK